MWTIHYYMYTTNHDADVHCSCSLNEYSLAFVAMNNYPFNINSINYLVDVLMKKNKIIFLMDYCFGNNFAFSNFSFCLLLFWVKISFVFVDLMLDARLTAQCVKLTNTHTRTCVVLSFGPNTFRTLLNFVMQSHEKRQTFCVRMFMCCNISSECFFFCESEKWLNCIWIENAIRMISHEQCWLSWW